MKTFIGYFKEVVIGITLFQYVISILGYFVVIPASIITFAQDIEIKFLLTEVLKVYLGVWIINILVTTVNRIYINIGYSGENIPELDIFKKADLSKKERLIKIRNKEALLDGLEVLDEKEAGYVLFLRPLERFMHFLSFVLIGAPIIRIIFEFYSNTLDWDSFGGWSAVNAFGFTLFFAVQTIGVNRLSMTIQKYKEERNENNLKRTELKLDVLIQKMTTIDKRKEKDKRSR